MKTPRRVKELNAFIQTSFQVCEGPSMSYIEFPMQITIGSGQSSGTAYSCKRIVYSSLAIRGDEAPCCKEIYDLLKSCVTPEVLQDHMGLIFIRTWFERSEGAIFGRLAFWEERSNEILENAYCFHRQGQIVKDVIVETAE